jgi:hypothetical protein
MARAINMATHTKRIVRLFYTSSICEIVKIIKPLILLFINIMARYLLCILAM